MCFAFCISQRQRWFFFHWKKSNSVGTCTWYIIVDHGRSFVRRLNVVNPIHSQKQISVSFLTGRNMTLVIAVILIMNQTEFSSVHNLIESCHYNIIFRAIRRESESLLCGCIVLMMIWIWKSRDGLAGWPNK